MASDKVKPMCSHPGCPKKARAGRAGKCLAHYFRARRRLAGAGTRDDAASFQVNTRLAQAEKIRLDEVSSLEGVPVYQILRELVTQSSADDLARAAKFAKARIGA